MKISSLPIRYWSNASSKIPSQFAHTYIVLRKCDCWSKESWFSRDYYRPLLIWKIHSSSLLSQKTLMGAKYHHPPPAGWWSFTRAKAQELSLSLFQSGSAGKGYFSFYCLSIANIPITLFNLQYHHTQLQILNQFPLYPDMLGIDFDFVKAAFHTSHHDFSEISLVVKWN